MECKRAGAVRALACKSKTHPCGRAGNTRLRLTRETPTGEYADEAASSAMSNIATRRAIAWTKRGYGDVANDVAGEEKRGHFEKNKLVAYKLRLQPSSSVAKDEVVPRVRQHDARHLANLLAVKGCLTGFS